MKLKTSQPQKYLYPLSLIATAVRPSACIAALSLLLSNQVVGQTQAPAVPAASPAATSAAQNAVLNLERAWDLAKTNDTGLKAAQAQVTAAKERSFQAQAANGLNINGTAGISEVALDTNLSALKFFTQPSVGLTLSYPLYRLQPLEQIEQAKLQITLAQTQLLAAEQDLMLRVAQAYFDVLTAQDVIAFTQAQKRAISEQLASAKRNFEVGTQTITDQQEAQARFDLVVAQELASENDLDLKKAALSTLTGVNVLKVQSLVANVDLIGPKPDNEIQWTEQAQSNSFTVLQSKIAAEIAKREVKRTSLGNRPTIDLVGSANVTRSSTTVPGLMSRTGSIGVQLNIPIFTGGAITSREREAVASLDKAENDVISAQRAASQAARTFFKVAGSGLGQVKALQAAERSSQLALDSNQLGYQVGVRINIDVLNAQQQLFSTRRDLAKARYDVLLNGLRLKQAVGTLTELDLKSVSALASGAQ